MRLKKVPAGATCIMMTNATDKDCLIYLNKKLFTCVKAKTWSFIESRNYFCGFPLEYFPRWQLYSNVKLYMEFVVPKSL